ncbi:unnamed protein product [Phytophthora fragariaefolia]|uniref:Unnamed protein product n=1 Tax=Phytophthora fragariaefolia TaxID=1490495 RepID=A0A9W6XCZ6_9STRA|nr:unnamed protein product [Phytophthora fragariaefolia]
MRGRSSLSTIRRRAKPKGYTPFTRHDRTPTAAGPATEVDDEDPNYCQTPDEETAEASADAKAKDAAKGAASLEASEGEEEEEVQEGNTTQKSAGED